MESGEDYFDYEYDDTRNSESGEPPHVLIDHTGRSASLLDWFEKFGEKDSLTWGEGQLAKKRFVMLTDLGTLIKTNADGSLQPVGQNIMNDGYGVNVERQEMPHPHSTVLSPDEKYLFVPNLGNDRLYRYGFNAGDPANPLTPLDPPYYVVPDNSGPRHFTFSANGKFAYLLNELSGNIIVYSHSDGNLTEIQTISSDITSGKGDKGSADIHPTADGRFLYTSNRVTSNDIAMYKMATDGKLAENGHQPVGAHPRNFIVDPTGRFLLVASRDANTIQIFIINKNFGILQDTGIKIDVPQPVCLKMVPVK